MLPFQRGTLFIEIVSFVVWREAYFDKAKKRMSLKELHTDIRARCKSDFRIPPYAA
jgi:hypothetical protein